MATRQQSTGPTLGIAAAIVLLASACGGASPATEATAASTSTTAGVVVSSATSPATTTEAAPATTTTAVEATSPVVPLDDIPMLVEAWGRGDGDPLDLARRIIGFPADIGVPDGAVTFDVSLDLTRSTTDPAEMWRWDWTYGAFSPIRAIDPDAEDAGPAAVEAAAIYDPMMAAEGWHRAARVVSNPGSGSDGPMSVNFAYSPEFEVLPIGSIEATPVVARVWADQDLDFARGADRPGYKIDLSARIVPGLVPAAIPAVLLDQLPALPGSTLTDVRFQSERPPGDLESADALRLLRLEYDFDLPDGSADAAKEAYSTGLDGSTFQIGEASWSDDGTIDKVTASVWKNTWTQKVIVLDRYVGSIDVVTDPDTGGVTARIRIDFEPDRVVLKAN